MTDSGKRHLISLAPWVHQRNTVSVKKAWVLVSIFTLLYAPSSVADFVINAESIPQKDSRAGRKQRLSFSLRGVVLRVVIEDDTGVTTILRDTASRITYVARDGTWSGPIQDGESKAKPAELPQVVFAPLARKAKIAGLSSKGYKVQIIRRFAGEPDDETTTFNMYCADWTSIGLKSAAEFSALLPPLETLSWHPELTLMTLSWIGLHPTMVSRLPGLTVQRSSIFGDDPNEVTYRVTSVATKALAEDAYRFPPPSGERDGGSP